ncbi:MAG: VOC family protein [Saprospiraceae bacterium]|nr:VOC family protein [Saprospiraceae bacterium]
MRYAHTNIIAKDWRSLANFYIEVFACKIVPPIRDQSGDWLSKGTGVPNAHLKGAHLLLPGHGKLGPTLEIYQYADMEDLPAIPPNMRGFTHLAFEVDDVAATLQEMEDLGGKRNGEVTSREIEGVGTITFVYARDPEGNLIELQSWKKNEI